jgi:DnaJ-class molecular chaperone
MKTKTVMMPRELTVENGAKALLSGEFKESIEYPCPDCDGDGIDYQSSLILGDFLDDCSTCGGYGIIDVTTTVSWTTIKEIYAMAVKHFGE